MPTRPPARRKKRPIASEPSVTQPVSLRERRRMQRQELNRTQLMEAAEVVFAEKGVHAATMREIATASEFSVGAVYSMFDSKDTLLTTLMEWRGKQFTVGAQAALAESMSPREQLHALATFQIEFFRQHKHFGRIWIRSSFYTLESLGSSIGNPTAVEAMHMQRAMFERGQASGQFRDGDPGVLMMLFSGLIMAYQSTDTLVLEDTPARGERLTLAQLHEILDGAFVRAG